MATREEDIIRRYFGAFNKHDLEGVIACFHPEPVVVFEMPATIHHFGWTTEETIIQEHGIGPLSVNYLKPAHDAPHR